MLVSVSSLKTAVADNLKDGVYAKASVGINCRAFAFDNGAWKIIRVDASGKELGVVVVDGLIVENFCTSWTRAVASRRIKSAIICVIVPNPGSSWRGASELVEGAWKRVRRP